MQNIQWDTSIETERSIANSQMGKFLKLPNDGDRARIVLLSAPTKQEKTGSNGAFVVYSIDVWNCGQAKQQTFDMAPALIDSLIAFKKEVGQDALYANELTVVRDGAANSKTTKYKWKVECPITAATRAAAEGKPAAPAAPTVMDDEMPAPKNKRDHEMLTADTLEELKEIYRKIQAALTETEEDDVKREENFQFFKAYRNYLKAAA